MRVGSKHALERAALALLLVLAASSAPSCRVARLVREPFVESRTRALVEQAEGMAEQGRAEEALRRVEEAVAQRPRGYEPFRIGFTRAWLRQVVAADEPDARRRDELLQEAAELYGSVLELQPGEPSALRNMALAYGSLGRHAEAVELLERVAATSEKREVRHACLMLVGDVLAGDENAQRDLARASDAYRRARELRPADRRAPERMVELGVRRLAEADDSERAARADELLLLCRDDLGPAGFQQAAALGCLALLRSCQENADRALVAWVELELERVGLTPAALEQLRSTGSCPSIETGRTELAALVAAPLDTSLAAQTFWRDGEADPERCAAFVRVKSSLAEASAFAGRLEDAERLLRSALEDALWAQRAGQGVALETALDLAILLHGHREELDPDRGKLRGLIREPPLVDLDGLDAAEPLVDRTPEEWQLVHTILGVVYAEVAAEVERTLASGGEPSEIDRDLARRAWGGLAKLHLDQARELAREGGRGPQPHLATIEGNGLGRSADPMQAYLEAARGYDELGASRRLREVHELALQRTLEGERTLQAIERLAYPTSGFYVGLGVGLTGSDVSSGDLQKLLADQGQQAQVDLDDERTGFRALVGWRSEDDYALELGYARFEGLDSSIRETNAPPDTGDLLDAVAASHPIAGEGLTLALQVAPIQGRRWQGLARAGAWWWWSRNEFRVVSSSAGNPIATRAVDAQGLDLFLGLGLEYRLHPRWSLRADAERYWLDRGHLDLLSLGLLYRF